MILSSCQELPVFVISSLPILSHFKPAHSEPYMGAIQNEKKATRAIQNEKKATRAIGAAQLAHTISIN